MDTIAGWLRNHPVGYPAILFLLACLVSIYAGEIRNFLHRWPRTTARAAMRNVTLHELEVLKNLQPGNTYNLLFYFGMQFIGFVFGSIGLLIIVSIAAAVMHWKISEAMYPALVGGAFVGRCNTVRKVLVQLGQYPDSVAKLEKRLADLQDRADTAQVGK